jgi:Fic family protein
MAYLSRKRIGGKHYMYLVMSIRSPDGNIRKIMKLIKDEETRKTAKVLERKYKDFFLEKEGKLNIEYAKNHFQTGYIFSVTEIEKLEKIKVNYKHLIKNLLKEQKKDIFDRFVVNFTYNSNAIEGNSLTLKDVRIIIFENDVARGVSLREIFETINSRKVTDLTLSKKFRISHRDIIKMHSMLMKDIDSRRGYKKIPNVILSVGREIRTTPPELVYKEMDKLIGWYNSSLGKLHPLELATIFHGRFERIHPFEDGNGRVGRFIVNTILVNNGYPPLIIRKTARNAYIGALRAFDSGYEDKLKRFMVEKFKETFSKFFEVYIKYV